MRRTILLSTVFLLWAGPATAIDPARLDELSDQPVASAASGAASIGALRRAATVPASRRGGIAQGIRSTEASIAPRYSGSLAAAPHPRALPRQLRIAPAAPDFDPRAADSAESENHHGFVVLLPPPPEFRDDALRPVNPEARYFELPPPPEG